MWEVNFIFSNQKLIFLSNNQIQTNVFIQTNPNYGL